MLLVIDNYDSFVHNLARLLRCAGAETHVVRNDQIDLPAIREMRPAGIVLSPGPLTPREAGISIEIVKAFGAETPILGVCLGLQTIGVACGAKLFQSEPVHGRATVITHDQTGLFTGIPSPCKVGRYHALSIDPDTISEEIVVTALADELVMGIRHRHRPLFGVQFHPESVLTEWGVQMLSNFLALTADKKTTSPVGSPS